MAHVLIAEVSFDISFKRIDRDESVLDLFEPR